MARNWLSLLWFIVLALFFVWLLPRCNTAQNGYVSGAETKREAAFGKATAIQTTHQKTFQKIVIAEKVEILVKKSQVQATPELFSAESLVSGVSIVLEGVNFEYDSAKLTEDSLFMLDSVAKTLNYEKQIHLEIAGYTDSDGDDLHNRELSRQRADTVKSFLVAKGVEEARLTANGYGPESPIADNTTAEGKAENRRVELHVQ